MCFMRACYIQHLHLTNFRENYKNVCYPDLKNNYCVSHFSTKLCLYSYSTRNSITGKTTVHINFIFVGLFGIHLLSHADIYLLYRGKFYICINIQLYSNYLQRKIHWDWPAVSEAIRGRPGYIIYYKLQRN